MLCANGDPRGGALGCCTWVHDTRSAHTDDDPRTAFTLRPADATPPTNPPSHSPLVRWFTSRFRSGPPTAAASAAAAAGEAKTPEAAASAGESKKPAAPVRFGNAVHLVGPDGASFLSSDGMTFTASSRKAAVFELRNLRLAQAMALGAEDDTFAVRAAPGAADTPPDGASSPSLFPWLATHHFPPELVQRVVRRFLPRGLQTTRLLCKEMERGARGFRVVVQNDFSSVNSGRLCAFVRRAGPSLVSLRLRNFHSLGDAQLAAAILGQGNDDDNINLHHTTVKTPAQPWAQCTEIDLNGCPEVGDRVVSALAHVCRAHPPTRTVRLACSALTDKGLAELLDGGLLRRAGRVNLYGCRCLTQTGIRRALARVVSGIGGAAVAPRLGAINLRGTALQSWEGGLERRRVQVLCGPPGAGTAFFSS